MKKIISRTIYLIFGALLLSFGIALAGLKAQTSEGKQQMEQLYKAILESKKKNQPKTLIKQSESLIQLAKRHKSFPYLAYATQCFWEGKQQLDRLNEEQDKQMFKAYQALEEIQWLSKEDRCVLSLIKLQLYGEYARYSGVLYHSKREDYGTREDRENPRYWSKAQYVKYVNKELDKVFSYKGLFNKSAKAYKILDLGKVWSFRDIKTKWTDKLGALVFLTSIRNYRSYDIIYNTELDDERTPAQQIKQELEDYGKSAPSLEAKLGAKFLYREVWGEGKGLNDFYAFYKPYLGEKALIPYLPILFGELAYLDKHRLIWEKIQEIEKAYPYAPKKIKEGIKQVKEIALSPDMSVYNYSPYIVGHKTFTMVVKHRQLMQVKFSIYEIPYLGKHQENYKPKAGAKPLKKIAFFPNEDKDWALQSDTIRFAYPKFGHYYVKFTPNFNPRITKAYDMAKMERLNTIGRSIYLTNKYALTSVVSPYPIRLQWLNAATGEPLSSLKVRKELVVGNKTFSNEILKTDQDGYFSLGKSFDGSERPYITALDKSDPLSFALHTDYNKAWSEISDENKKRDVQARILVLTDRPIYKRGQKIEIFGFLAGLTTLAEEGQVLPNKKLKIKIINRPNWTENVVKEINCTTDDYGRFACSAELSNSAPLGEYSIEIEYRGAWRYEFVGQKQFLVEAYQRPTYELSVKQPEQGYRLGDTIKIESLVKEINGSPLKDCKLTYSIQRRLYSWRWFGRNEVYNLPQIELNTDAEGRATASIVLEKESSEDNEKALYVFDINVQATSQTGEVQTKHLQLLVGDEFVNMDLTLPKFIEKHSDEDKFLVKVSDFAHNELAYELIFRVLNQEGTLVQTFKAKSNEELTASEYLDKLEKGIYTLEASLCLKNGQEVKKEQKFVLWDRRAETIDFLDEKFFAIPSSPTFDLGENLELYYATALDKPYIFYEIYLYTGKLLQKGLLRPEKNKLCRLTLPTPKALDHQMELHLHFVHKGQLYKRELKIKGLQKEKKLSLKWEVIRHRILAGSQEEWRARVYKDGKPIKASVSAWLYDSALNSLVPNFAPYLLPDKERIYSHFSTSLKPFAYRLDLPEQDGLVGAKNEHKYYAFSMDNEEGIMMERNMELSEVVSAAGLKVRGMSAILSPTSEQKPSSIRKNFSETAFCYPKKLTEDDGSLALSFTMPESLTRWQFYLIAHTKDLYQTLYSDEIETYRELELKPFMPRFLRSGDEVAITYSLRNLSEKKAKVKVQVQYYLFDGDNTFKEANIINQTVIEAPKVQKYKLSPKEQTNGSFIIKVPNYRTDKRLGIRITAVGKRFSDGEEHILDIQGNGVEVQRTQAITIASDTKEGKSEQVQLDNIYPRKFNELQGGRFNFSLESNPLLYTIDALPMLSPKVYSQNAIDLLTNYYSLAVSHKLTTIDGFSDYLRQQNPYLRDSLTKRLKDAPHVFGIRPKKEEARHKELSNFFDEISNASIVKEREDLLIRELMKLQDDKGYFSWFVGMTKSDYITEYVLMQLLRREQITKPSKAALVMRQKAWRAYQDIIRTELKYLKKVNKNYPKLDYLTPRLLNFLFLSSEMSGASSSASKSKLYAQVLEVVRANKDYTYDLPLLQKLRAYYALASNEPTLAKDLMKSIKEHIIKREDGACYFPSAGSYYWRNPQYALQSEMILYLVHFEPQEKALIRGLKQWLLREKRATQWESSVATLDAIYGLWISGKGRMESKRLKSCDVELRHNDEKLASLSGQHITFSQTIGSDKEQAPNKVLVNIKGEGDVWGMAKLTYNQKMQKVQAGGKELRLERAYYLQKQEGKDIVFRELKEGDKLSKGDIIEVRLYIKLDRAMDFVQISDPRLLFAEHLDKRSRYVWGYGLTSYFYEVGKETTKLYFDKLTRGEYNFSYKQAVVRSGRFSLPNASAQSLYAPEYSALTPFGGYQFISE